MDEAIKEFEIGLSVGIIVGLVFGILAYAFVSNFDNSYPIDKIKEYEEKCSEEWFYSSDSRYILCDKIGVHP
jgi:uncharacterized membrane protein